MESRPECQHRQWAEANAKSYPLYLRLQLVPVTILLQKGSLLAVYVLVLLLVQAGPDNTALIL